MASASSSSPATIPLDLATFCELRSCLAPELDSALSDVPYCGAGAEDISCFLNDPQFLNEVQIRYSWHLQEQRSAQSARLFHNDWSDDEDVSEESNEIEVAFPVSSDSGSIESWSDQPPFITSSMLRNSTQRINVIRDDFDNGLAACGPATSTIDVERILREGNIMSSSCAVRVYERLRKDCEAQSDSTHNQAGDVDDVAHFGDGRRPSVLAPAPQTMGNPHADDSSQIHFELEDHLENDLPAERERAPVETQPQSLLLSVWPPREHSRGVDDIEVDGTAGRHGADHFANQNDYLPEEDDIFHTRSCVMKCARCLTWLLDRISEILPDDDENDGVRNDPLLDMTGPSSWESQLLDLSHRDRRPSAGHRGYSDRTLSRLA